MDDGDFAGVPELSARLAASPQLPACFARQVYRYALGQVEAPAEDMAWLTSAASPDARMTDLFLAITGSAIFAKRSFE